MNIQTIIFYIAAGVLCAAALQTVLLKNPVHACLSLILAFLSSSVLWMLLEAEFLSLILILIYVGAVMVLFLFVIMMLNKNIIDHFRKNFYAYLPMTLLLVAILMGEMIYIIIRGIDSSQPAQIFHPKEVSSSNAHAIGKILFEQYLLAFEVVGIILLLAIVVAVVLNLRERKDKKSLDVAQQLKSNRSGLQLLSSKIVRQRSVGEEL